MISVLRNVQNSKPIETENGLVVTRAGRVRENGECLPGGTGFYFLKVFPLKCTVVMAVQPCEFSKNREFNTLKWVSCISRKPCFKNK